MPKTKFPKFALLLFLVRAKHKTTPASFDLDVRPAFYWCREQLVLGRSAELLHHSVRLHVTSESDKADGSVSPRTIMGQANIFLLLNSYFLLLIFAGRITKSV